MKRVGLFFGGVSNEHDVSVVSALNIAKNIDKKKYKLIPIFWDKNGNFYLVPDISKLNKRKIITIENFKKNINVALLITHGKYGEDGILQSIFEIQHIPYSGCHVLSSALCMDKAVFKNFMSKHNIPQSKYSYIDFELQSKKQISDILKRVKRDFYLPVFIKPANSGSSVGITKITDFSKLNKAIQSAKKHDSKIIFEEGFINHKEIEIAVLGNNKLFISSPGELIIHGDFYDYDEKYKKGRTQMIIPAKIDAEITKEIKKMAEIVYRLCECSGFARIDFFIKNKKIYINEINTLPGFTNISMYPMLMTNSGLSYKKLISKIIDLAY
ncbi:MAG: D-alanine--D-alanine ligase [Candidatus Parcubacteria bacterium]|nr:D-alanine--D-alanine ligase [Candidatus Parcubacteria bacterium]